MGCLFVFVCVLCFFTGIPPAPRGVPQIEVTFDLDANGEKHTEEYNLHETAANIGDLYAHLACSSFILFVRLDVLVHVYVLQASSMLLLRTRRYVPLHTDIFVHTHTAAAY